MEKPYGIISKFSKYIAYRYKAQNRHGVHSPFVYDFIETVLNSKYSDPAIELERKSLLRSKKKIFIADFGSGNDRTSTLSKIASNSLKRKKEASLLAKIVQHYSIKNVIELGTSLGISTSYMARVNPKCNIKTVEGSQEIAEQAKNVWDSLSINNIDSYSCEFDQFLEGIKNETFTDTLIFIDGNHRLKPTLNYFEFFKKRSHKNCILVFDDIHWSQEMEDAWDLITHSKDIDLSIDLFELGLVFLDERMEKEHFILSF
jgi:predicted O-methyltransferase YrrM